MSSSRRSPIEPFFQSNTQVTIAWGIALASKMTTVSEHDVMGEFAQHGCKSRIVLFGHFIVG
jgi:hypothetical protein